MSSLVRNLMFAFGLAVIIWLGYILFLQEDDSILESSGNTTANLAARETQNFLVRLQELNKVKIEGTIFDDTRFTSLIDFREEIPEEPTGRANPFAPVGEDQ